MSVYKTRYVMLLIASFCLVLQARLYAETETETEAAPEAEQASPLADFLRTTRDEKDRLQALETAIVRYVPAEGDEELFVDLVGVAHVGEKEYYRELNELLQEYDVVLYELVAPEGTRIPKGGGQAGFLPQMMKGMLKMEYQTEQIDYSPEHFLHADMSPEAIGEKMRERGQTALGIGLEVLGNALRQMQQAKTAAKPELQVDPILLLLDPQGPLKMKRAFAVELERAEASSGLGDTLTTMLIADRNEAALEVLKDQLDEGKKRIAIFYGAAHMPDFAERLEADFNLKRDSSRWLKAWNLQK